MLRFDKDKIVQELKLLRKPELAEKIFAIANLIAEKKVTRKMRSEVKAIIQDIFGNFLDKSINIPLEFLETVTGEVLLTAFYNLEQYITITDMVEMTGYSRQWIWQCAKSGKLKGGAKFGRDYVFPSSSVDDLK